MLTSCDRPIGFSTRLLWAKTGSSKHEEGHLWAPLYVHMADSAEVAHMLWRKWLPRATKAFIANEMELEEEDAGRGISWLAAVHDIGKATPRFQEQARFVNESLISQLEASGFILPKRISNKRQHAEMGQIILQKRLEERGWDNDIALTYTSIIGGHHGVTPNESELDGIASANRRDALVWLGDERWSDAQGELFEYANAHTEIGETLSKLKDRALSPAVQVLLTGLIIVSDWIASNTDHFPLTSGEKLSWLDSRLRAERAWDELDLPEPLVLNGVLTEDDALFRQRFKGLPEGAQLRPAQEAAMQAARDMQEPGLIIIEAPMGNGKTEASLLCAEILAEKFGDGGVAYLLPTMATSNAMFSRVHAWLNQLCEATGADVQSLRLMHSKAELNDEYRKLEAWRTSWMGDSDSSDDNVIAHQWFSGRKRGLLSSFVVGTVDQLLMAALNAKHVHLRHLGLAGKVVVVDEVHAYDAYMNVYLDRALQFLGNYGVPVILLSATLPPDRREALIKAYRNSRKSAVLPETPRQPNGAPAYPLVTSVSHNANEEPHYVACGQEARSTTVLVDYLSDDNDLLLEELSLALSDGGCACVIRDTVGRAQRTYEAIAEKLDAEVLLVHSRFIAIDRAKNDNKLLELLGPDSTNRPEKLVVVGTQVIEQSLDIDFDIMFTDVAPMDLLLQRMGRLHRHPRGKNQCERPSNLRQARCVITGAKDWNEDLPEFDAGIKGVYEEAVLWKSLLTLRTLADNQKTRLDLPGDIAMLVESTYGVNADAIHSSLMFSEKFTNAQRALEEHIYEKRKRAENWLLRKYPRVSLNGWMRKRLNLEEEQIQRAAVRDTKESLEVILVHLSDNVMKVPSDIAAEKGVSGILSGGGCEVDSQSAQIALSCAVALPPMLCIPGRFDRVVSFLEEQYSIAWDGSPWLRGQLPLVLDEDGKGVIMSGDTVFDARYSRETGLLVEERKEDS